MALLPGHIATITRSVGGSFQAADFGNGSMLVAWQVVNTGKVNINLFDGQYVIAPGKQSVLFQMQWGYEDKGTYFYTFQQGEPQGQSMLVVGVFSDKS